MKKYIIKNADGSEQTVMRAVHNSRKEAGRVLMRYLSYHNENWDVDSHLSPFDFTLEEVDVNDVNETIMDFESARETLGLKPNVAYIPKSGDVKRLVTDINPKHIEALIALNKLFTIAQAWNEADEFVPDFSDWEQDKWYPLFKYDEDAAEFVCADAQYTSMHYTLTNVAAYINSRLCFKTSARATQFGKLFVDLYNKVFL